MLKKVSTTPLRSCSTSYVTLSGSASSLSAGYPVSSANSRPLSAVPIDTCTASHISYHSACGSQAEVRREATVLQFLSEVEKEGALLGIDLAPGRL